MQIETQAETERWWATLRLILGLLQMAGAAFTLALLVETGVNKSSLAAVTATGLLTTISVLLFGKYSWVQKHKAKGGNSRDQT